MRTLESIMASAVAPWNSVDSVTITFYVTPQEEIDRCLSCPHCASSCDRCDGSGNLCIPKGSVVRRKSEIDMAALRNMLAENRCNREMCAALGISVSTLNRTKKRLAKGAEWR